MLSIISYIILTRIHSACCSCGIKVGELLTGNWIEFIYLFIYLVLMTHCHRKTFSDSFYRMLLGSSVAFKTVLCKLEYVRLSTAFQWTCRFIPGTLEMAMAPQDITQAHTYEQFRDRELAARIWTAQKGWEIQHAKTKLFITRMVHCFLKAKDA